MIKDYTNGIIQQMMIAKNEQAQENMRKAILTQKQNNRKRKYDQMEEEIIMEYRKKVNENEELHLKLEKARKKMNNL